MAKFGLKLKVTLGKHVSDDPRHFNYISFFGAESIKGIKFLQNFERPFTPWGWLLLASTFGKTRFRWSPTFHLLTSRKKWRKKSTKNLSKTFDRKFGKLPILGKLWTFGRNRQMRLEKWPPRFWFSILYDFWRRGKRDCFHFSPTFVQKRFSQFLTWLEDTCVLARRHTCLG